MLMVVMMLLLVMFVCPPLTPYPPPPNNLQGTVEPLLEHRHQLHQNTLKRT